MACARSLHAHDAGTVGRSLHGRHRPCTPRTPVPSDEEHDGRHPRCPRDRSASTTRRPGARGGAGPSPCSPSSAPASSSWWATTTPAAWPPTPRPGQNFGLSLLWTLPLLIPVLVVNQEMVVRLGAVCGVGHARLINERFGRFWGAFSVGDLFILNFLTIVTEFIGVSLALVRSLLQPLRIKTTEGLS